jgi:hypothetical protein
VATEQTSSRPRVERRPLDPSSPAARAAARRRRQQAYRRRRIGAVVVVVFLAAVGLVGVTVVGAASSPGNDPFEAKWADWLRSHHLAALITPLESWYYNAQAPAKGGQLRRLNLVPVTHPAMTTKAAAGAISLPAPAPVPLDVFPALPGEGVWEPVGGLIDGKPAMYEAQFRADAVYTSQITTAVWIDPRLARVSLVPGSVEPGGTWPVPSSLDGAAADAALAAFNGGFRFQDAHGGFYLDGRTAVPLVAGAASVVIYDNGRVNVGAWGSEVAMTPHVTAVLQNLVPIVDGGRPAPSATYSDRAIWGATIGSSTVVARSGLGVTASGGLVYVAGPALSAKSLAESLQRAGAVRAMSLDINPDWVTFNFYVHPPYVPATTGIKLYPQMLRSANRYLGPASDSRDFFVVSAPG